jgi:hypothetical protein
MVEFIGLFYTSSALPGKERKTFFLQKIHDEANKKSRKSGMTIRR